MKKILSVFICAMLFVLVVPSKTVFADSEVFGGYYEQAESTSTLEINQTIPFFSSLTVSGSGIFDKTITGYSVKGNKITFAIEDTFGMVLGNTYSLNLNGANLSITFKYISKYITDKSDLSCMDIKDEKDVKGYFVLGANLVLEKGENNKNAGSGTDKEAGGAFCGTFDGNGHTISFYTAEKGFFALLGGNAVIKNVGFVDVKYDTVSYSGLSPVIAKYTTATEDEPVLIKDVYVKTESKPCGGAILWKSGLNCHVDNFIVEIPGLNHGNLDSLETSFLGTGAIFGHERGWYEEENADCDLNITNTYVLANCPVMYYRWTEYLKKGKNSPTKTGGSSGIDLGWYEGVAGNEGITQNLDGGVKVFRNVKKYKDYSLMKKAQNNYSGFNTDCWDVTSFGVPVWKEYKENLFGIFIDTAGYATSSKIYLDTTEITSATVGYGLLGVSAEGATTSYEFVSGSDIVSVSDTGLITAKNVGKAVINFAFTYNGKTESKKITVEVEQGKIAPNPQNEESPKGCGTVSFNDFTGGGTLMLLAGGIVLIIRKRKFA